MDNRQGNLNGLILIVVWWVIAQETTADVGEAFWSALIVTAGGLVGAKLFLNALKQRDQGGIILGVLSLWAGGVICLMPAQMSARLFALAAFGLPLLVAGYGPGECSIDRAS